MPLIFNQGIKKDFQEKETMTLMKMADLYHGNSDVWVGFRSRIFVLTREGMGDSPSLPGISAKEIAGRERMCLYRLIISGLVSMKRYYSLLR